jgi:hypothetical protein
VTRSATRLAHFLVVEDAQQRHALPLSSPRSSRRRHAVAGVKRGGRLVEQQDAVIGDEAARDVDALLLAARKGRRRQAPEFRSGG